MADVAVFGAARAHWPRFVLKCCVLSAVAGAALATTLPNAPLITYTSGAKVAIVGASGVTLEVRAVGDAPLRYQWKKDGADIPGATNATYLTTSDASAGAGTYTAVVTNAAGSATSTPCAVTAIPAPPPQPHYQPADIAVRTDDALSTSFQLLTRDGAHFQWRKDGVVIPGATDDAYYKQPVTAADAGVYTCEATNSGGTVVSTGGKVTVLAAGAVFSAPQIMQAPHPVIAKALDDPALYVTAEGEAPLSYQWLKDGVALPGQTKSQYRVMWPTAADEGSYSVVVTNRVGSATAGPVSVTLNKPTAAPIITAHPAPQTVVVGATFLDLSVTTLDDYYERLSYQWKKDGMPITGATARAYTLPDVTADTAGKYSVVVSNAAGSSTSNEAVVSVYGSGSSFAGVYQGSTLQNGFGSGYCSVVVDAQGNGTLFAKLSGMVVGHFKVQPDGTFSFGSSTANDGAAGLDAHFDLGAISGQFTQDRMDAHWADPTKRLWSMFAIRVAEKSSVFAALAGVYHAEVGEGGPGTFDLIVAPDGSGVAYYTDVESEDASTAPVLADSRFFGQVSTGTIDAATHSVKGSYLRWWATPSTRVPFSTHFDNPGKLINVSTRGYTGGGAQMLTAGFVIGGSGRRKVLIRGVGPALKAFAVPDYIQNPRLALVSDGATIASNDDWSSGAGATDIAATADKLSAFPLTAGTADAALIAQLAPGLYTAQVQGGETIGGGAMVEVYDADAGGSAALKVLNLSSRGYVGKNSPLIAGFVIDGTAPKKILVRAIGPGLIPFKLTDVLADPKLQIFRVTTVLRSNDNWSESFDPDSVSAAGDAVGAFPLAAGSKDAAILTVLTPGSYTAVLSGDTAGLAMVEVYEVP